MSHTLWFALPGIVAAFLSLLLTPLAAWIAVRVGAIDMPGERKVHKTPIPRLGGLAVVASIACTFAAAHVLSGGRWQLPSDLAVGGGGGGGWAPVGGGVGGGWARPFSPPSFSFVLLTTSTAWPRAGSSWLTS